MGKLMDTHKKIERGVIKGYKAIENGVVSSYMKIQDKFVAAFLTPDADLLEKQSITTRGNE